MWEVIELVVLYFPILIPVPAPAKINTHPTSHPKDKPSKKSLTLSVVPVDGIRCNVNSVRRVSIMPTIRETYFALAFVTEFILPFFAPMAF
jgi:hypothetical protein